MSIRNSEIPEAMMMQEEFVSIPVSVFEDLIRAETERDILEAVLTGNHKYNADDVMTAIQAAREKHRRGVLHIEIDGCSCAEPASEMNSDAEMEVLDEKEIVAVLTAMVESGELNTKQALACGVASTIVKLWLENPVPQKEPDNNEASK